VKYLPKMSKISHLEKIRKGNSVKTPKIESEYLTSDKEYVIEKVFIDGAFLITDDTGQKLFCKLLECGHLDGKNWNLIN